jgi:hypothetical protein
MGDVSRVQTRVSSLGAARPLPPRADIGPGGQSVDQAAQFCLAAHAAAEDISSAPQRCPREGNKELGLFDFELNLPSPRNENIGGYSPPTAIRLPPP